MTFCYRSCKMLTFSYQYHVIYNILRGLARKNTFSYQKMIYITFSIKLTKNWRLAHKSVFFQKTFKKCRVMFFHNFPGFLRKRKICKTFLKNKINNKRNNTNNNTNGWNTEMTTKEFLHLFWGKFPPPRVSKIPRILETLETCFSFI